MELMLDFMYSGGVALSSNMLKSFLKTADELGVKGLTFQDTKERLKCHSHNAGFKAKSSSSPKMQARALKSITAEKEKSSLNTTHNNYVGEWMGATVGGHPGKSQLQALESKSTNKIGATLSKQTVDLIPGQKLLRTSDGHLCVSNGVKVERQSTAAPCYSSAMEPATCAMDPTSNGEIDEDPLSLSNMDFPTIEMPFPGAIASLSKDSAPAEESMVLRT